MKDFSKFYQALEKKDNHLIKFLLENYKKENSSRLETWKNITVKSLSSFQGYFFIKNQGLFLYGKIVPEIFFVFLSINHILEQTLKNLTSNSKLVKENIKNLENLESRFEKLSLKFSVYYQTMSAVVGAYHFYKKNLSLTIHFLDRLEKQFNLKKLDLLSISELNSISIRLTKLAEEYLQKANKNQ
ncbi:MAG: hypothetical protein ACK4J0_00220 [Candidatus Anstonellaceae archaeon]